jgi:hypothetical protein
MLMVASGGAWSAGRHSTRAVAVGLSVVALVVAVTVPALRAGDSPQPSVEAEPAAAAYVDWSRIAACGMDDYWALGSPQIALPGWRRLPSPPVDGSVVAEVGGALATWSGSALAILRRRHVALSRHRARQDLRGRHDRVDRHSSAGVGGRQRRGARPGHGCVAARRGLAGGGRAGSSDGLDGTRAARSRGRQSLRTFGVRPRIRACGRPVAAAARAPRRFNLVTVCGRAAKSCWSGRG